MKPVHYAARAFLTFGQYTDKRILIVKRKRQRI